MPWPSYLLTHRPSILSPTQPYLVPPPTITQVLDLSNNEFSAEGVAVLADATRNAAGLRQLRLLGNKIPFGLDTLRQLMQVGLFWGGLSLGGLGGGGSLFWGGGGWGARGKKGPVTLQDY